MGLYSEGEPTKLDIDVFLRQHAGVFHTTDSDGPVKRAPSETVPLEPGLTG